MKNKTLKIKLNNGYANMFLADEFNGYSVYTGSEFLHLTTVKYLQQILGYGYDISKAPRVRFKNNLNEFEDLVNEYLQTNDIIEKLDKCGYTYNNELNKFI